MTKEEKSIEKAQATFAARFTAMVVQEFGSTVGTLQLTPYQQRLAQHMFICIDAQLKTLEAKRQKEDKDGLPIVWNNINMEKLAVDVVHRIELGLDALIPNHLHPIPYKNSRTKKYDLDLRVGYVGKEYYRRKMAIDQPVDIIYELVHKKDKFVPIKKTIDNPVDSYHLEILEPFDRGEVVGGFGYIVYDDPERNKLVLVSKADFDKASKSAKSDAFWGRYEKEMQFKTLVHRVTGKLNIDPEKVNASFMAVEMEDNEREITEQANKEVIDIEPESGQKLNEAQEKLDKLREQNGQQRTVNCQICGASCLSERGLKKHMTQQHPATDDVDPGTAFLARCYDLKQAAISLGKLGDCVNALKQLGYERTEDVKPEDYDAIIAALEHVIRGTDHQGNQAGENPGIQF